MSEDWDNIEQLLNNCNNSLLALYKASQILEIKLFRAMSHSQLTTLSFGKWLTNREN